MKLKINDDLTLDVKCCVTKINDVSIIDNIECNIHDIRIKPDTDNDIVDVIRDILCEMNYKNVGIYDINYASGNHDKLNISLQLFNEIKERQ